MTFLSPWAAITAAAIALPALLLLYFLKLRRFPIRIPSTLLWRKSIEDLQVNAPFQRLRFTLLFLLQLLILSLFLLALGQPVIRGDETTAGRLIILIDRSASMNARDQGAGRPTRLERAKESAIELIDGLGSAENPAEAMIVAFAGSPAVVHAFDGDRRRLREAVESLEPTDEPADLAAALELADAYATAGDEDAAPPTVALISDGGVEPPRESAGQRGFRVRAGAVRFVQVGRGDDGAAGNAGIVAMSARRRFDEPARVDLFIRVISSGAIPLETTLTIRIDDRSEAVRTITIPPAQENDAPAGAATESFDLELPGGALITASLGTPDALAVDDFASVVLPAPEPPSILLIARDGAPDPFVLNLLESAQPRTLEVRSDVAYAQDVAAGQEGASHDLIVFDRVAPSRLPTSPTLFLGALPPGIEPLSADDSDASGGVRILSWSRSHPLLQHVELDDIVFEGFPGFIVPDDMENETVELAFGPRGPVLGAIEAGDALHAFVGFELVRSNWPADVSLLIFLKNVLDRAMGVRGSGESISFRTGEVARVGVAPGVDQISLRGPAEAAVDGAGRSHITLPALRRAGVYRVDGAAEPMNRVAVNLVNEIESDLRPRGDITINAQAVAANDVASIAARELWPWLVAGALVLLVLEWLVYSAKARG